MDSYKSYFIAFTLILFVSLQGCTNLMHYGPDGQSRDEFERRVEAAFRLQNQMTSEVMVLQSDGTNPKAHAPIIQAEQFMEKYCHHLNEYASLEIEGLNKSLLLLRRVEASVADCEMAARKVEELLKQHPY